MTTFLIAAVVLILLPIAFLFPVLLKRRSALLQSPAAARNLHILREQLAELEREHTEGLLSETDFKEAREDLERRLLEENAPGEQTDDETTPAQSPAQNSPLAAALLTLTLVVGGLFGYLWLGTPEALDKENLVHAAGHAALTAEQIDAMVSQLEERQKENPDDEEGWLNLASAYQMLGRPADAVTAYEKAEARIGLDPDLLTGYAEALALTAIPQNPDDKSAFQGKPRRLLLEALKLEPEHPKALFLAGAAAFEAGDKEEAVVHWEKLLPHVEPGSELQALLVANIERFRAEMAESKASR